MQGVQFDQDVQVGVAPLVSGLQTTSQLTLIGGMLVHK